MAFPPPAPKRMDSCFAAARWEYNHAGSPPEMKLRFTIAGLCVFALIALPLRAQHGGGGHGGGGGHAGGGRHGGGGESWHAGSACSGGGHYSGGDGEYHGNPSGSYGGTRMYPPPVRGRATVSSPEPGRPGAGYSTNHEPSSQSGWQALYSDGPDIHFSASMLPPNARGYSAAPRESVSGVTPGATRNETRRLQSEWIARPEMDGISHHRHHFYGGVGRGYGGYFCGPFRGFGFCGGPFFYGFYDEGFGCGGGNYWGVSDGELSPPVLNFAPCFAASYAPDENQTSPYDSYDQSGNVSPPDAAPAGENSVEETAAAPVVAERRPETLLQLKDGSMYGLTQYWVAGGLLNYITDYGARNAIPFDRIDFAKTVQLNSQRGVPFVLQTNAPSN